MATEVKEYRYTEAFPFNAICPDCSRRYTVPENPVGGFIDVTRCQTCIAGGKRRDSAADGYRGDDRRRNRRYRKNYGTKPIP